MVSFLFGMVAGIIVVFIVIVGIIIYSTAKAEDMDAIDSNVWEDEEENADKNN